MPDAWDGDLRNSPDSPPPPARGGLPSGPLLAAGVLVVAAVIAAYFVFSGPPAPAPVSTAEAPETAPAAAPPQPLGSDAEAIDVPPLDESDDVVRDLARALSSHPGVTAWLATKGLVRTVTVVVTNIAEGATPSRHLPTLRPSTTFQVVERDDGNVYIDPRSYDRYTPLAGAIASIDTAGSARLYTMLKPRIEEAHRDLGYPDTSFDRTLERAIVSLLETPVVEGPIRVEPAGIGYRYEDARLEELTAAQKHLLRFGPANVQTVQDALRDLALALGIPAARLPAARR
jgi:hypothetical protein